MIGITDGAYKPLVYENGNLVRSGGPYAIDNSYSSELLLQGEFDFARLELLDGVYAMHSYFGKASKNLIKSRVGGFSGTITYYFDKDGKGNITRMVEVTGTGANALTRTTNYTYKCF